MSKSADGRTGRLRPRRGSSGWSIAAVAVGAIALVAASVGMAFGNAANPLNDSKGTGTISGTVITNPDGSITVKTGTVAVEVGGTWNWGEISNSSPQSDCNNRWGVGWAVDWLGISTNPGTRSLAIGKGGKNPGGQFFHVGPIVDGSFQFPPSGSCTDVGTLRWAGAPNGEAAQGSVDAQDFPQGAWKALHTYSAGETIARNLCVNMYDLHGNPTENGPKNAGLDATNRELDPLANNDNSIKTNSFDPTVGQGYCFTPRLLNAPALVTTATDATVGSAISDKATLSGTANASGTITFTAYSDAACATKVYGPVTVNVTGNGTFGGPPAVSYTPAAAGEYRWIAAYSGDNSNAPITGVCGDAGETSTVGNKPDVKIVKQAPSQVTLGDNIVYNLTASNTGSVLAPNVIVNDDVPATTTLVSVGAGCTGTTTITCDAGDLAVGASKSFTFTVKTTAVGTVKNTAVVTPNDNTPNDNISTVTTTVGPAPVVDVKIVKEAPTQVVLGDSIPYTLTASNTGNVVAPNVLVTDAVPATTTLENLGLGCTGTTTVTCDAGTLAVGASKVFHFSVKTTAVGTVTNTGVVTPNDGTPDDNTSTVKTTVSPGPVADLGIKKTVDAAQVVLGKDLTYTLTVTNTGSQAVANGVVSDTLPDNVDLVTNDPGCSNAARVITCNVPNLAVGATKAYTVKVHPTAVGTVTNTATVGPNDGTPDDNTSTVTSTVIAPDLKIVKVGTPATVVLGNNLTYTLTVSNTGDAASADGTVSDTLPGNVDLVTNDPGCTATGKVITCAVGNLDPNATKVFTIVVKPTATGTVTNTATVGPTDKTPDDNTSTTTSKVTAPDLKIVKSGPATATVGDDVTYTLTVSNTGDADATNATVTDAVPTNATFKSASSGCVLASAVVTCTIATLPVGGTTTFSLVLTATAAGTITNTAVVAPTDKTPEDNTSTVKTTVTAVLGEVITKPPTAPAPAPATLPRTGSDFLPILGFGAGLVLMGMGLLLAGDRPWWLAWKE